MAVSSACRRQLAREKSARRFVRRALNACEHSYARGRKGALRARTYATAHHGLHRVLDEPERKILMENLSGHAAFRTPADEEKWKARQQTKKLALKAAKEETPEAE